MRVFQEKPLQLVPIVCGEKGKGPDAAFLQRALRLGGVQRARTAELNPGHHRVPEKEGKGQQKNAQNRAGCLPSSAGIIPKPYSPVSVTL